LGVHLFMCIACVQQSRRGSVNASGVPNKESHHLNGRMRFEFIQKEPLYLLQCTFAFKISAWHVLKLNPIYDKNEIRTKEILEVKNVFIVLESC